MKKNKHFTLSLLLGAALCLTACQEGKKKQPPVKFDKAPVTAALEVPFTETGGVKTIPVKINGVTMQLMLDSGCSGISLSLHELRTLVKNGKLLESDLIGTSYAAIADGSVVETGLINLREIEIGGAEGIRLYNVEASVALNQQAPALLGNSVLDKVDSWEVDNQKEVFRFKLK